MYQHTCCEVLCVPLIWKWGRGPQPSKQLQTTCRPHLLWPECRMSDENCADPPTYSGAPSKGHKALDSLDRDYIYTGFNMEINLEPMHWLATPRGTVRLFGKKPHAKSVEAKASLSSTTGVWYAMVELIRASSVKAAGHSGDPHERLRWAHWSRDSALYRRRADAREMGYTRSHSSCRNASAVMARICHSRRPLAPPHTTRPA
ncbi:hypothetical protein FIBSPDRAFT_400229 [Athelia psychrophila]|uniref:Uncharacterized protein n=1 Tax=Athelia psychrophila TaxID=1759441 RepID=A0A166NGF8_9AGAM|nr:hypothetical protein FIBSPDRAFT_400229 [Fibularhizoctonia sp. CBS 109695]